MRVEMFTAPNCSYCEAAKRLLAEHGIGFVERDASDPAVRAEFRERLPREKAVPQILIDGEHIGGYEDLRLRAERGELAATVLRPATR